MKAVELIYGRDCPNVELTRSALLKAFAGARIPARWVEWVSEDASSPSRVRAYGSPTVLVDGKDVAGIDPSGDISCCRLYAASGGGFSGAPSVEMITAALRKAGDGLPAESGEGKSAGWRNSLIAAPGIGASLLPVGLCPACWPAYGGLLSSLGLGFLQETVYLLPLTVFFLAIAVGALAFKAKTRRGYGPFLLGLAASVAMLVAKFIFGSDIAMYSAISVLIVASLWNAWPGKNADAGKEGCMDCVSSGKRVRSKQNEAAKRDANK